MALTKCTVPTDVIGSLGTNVQDRGLTTQQFKDKFDEMPEGIKQYINEVLTEEIDAHIAESMSYATTVTRDISVAGVQTISLPFLAKSIQISAVIDNTKVTSQGIWAENNLQRCIYQNAGTATFKLALPAISLVIDGGTIMGGTIQNVTATGFEINWVKTGVPTGTANIMILASTH